MSRALKPILRVVAKPSRHWVGNSFNVRGMFDYEDFGQTLNPFVLLDYGAPYDFEPTDKPRKVGFHPHKGIETVTVAYQGEVAHQDTAGHGGVISPGDVQWMTAGKGTQHQESHSDKFTKEGGTMEMVQLWVNLKSKDKKASPKYQSLAAAKIPSYTLPDENGTIRVIAGDYNGTKGPAQTFTPMNIFDVVVNKGKTVKLELPEDWSTGLLVRKGDVLVNGKEVSDSSLVVFRQKGTTIELKASKNTDIFLFSGEALREPIVGSGPFVMNTQSEIQKAWSEYQQGKFGKPRAH